MRKPKSKSKQLADLKRAAKRDKRLKESRKKLLKRKLAAIAVRIEEKKKYREFVKKLEVARNKGKL